MTARVVVFILAVLFVYNVVIKGSAPAGREVAGIQQIKDVFDKIDRALKSM